MKAIPAYEGLYSVTDDGRIFSVRSDKFIKPFHKKGKKGEDSYLRIALQNCGEIKRFFVHRLVAMAYVDNTDDKPFVNHIDGDVMNNVSDNLEWCTQSENQNHAYATGLQKPNNGVKFSNNTSGYVGVTKCGNKWKAQIRIKTELHYLGLYDTAELASEVYQEALSGLVESIGRGKK